MENVWNCPLCNSDFTHHQFFERVPSKHWNGVAQDFIQITYAICDHCGLVFLWDRYDDEEQDNYYRNGDYRSTVQGTPVITDRVLKEQNARVEFLMPEIDVEQVRFALDVGASTGLLMKALQEKYDCKVLGIEPGEHFRLQSGVKMFSEMDLLYSKEYYNAFDLITCIHTLEHMNDPLHFLTQLHEFISEDGHVFIEVPNLLTEQTMTISHPIVFTKETLTTALGLTGWEIVWMKEYHSFKEHLTLPPNILVKVKPGNVSEYIASPDMDALRASYTENMMVLREDMEKLKK